MCDSSLKLVVYTKVYDSRSGKHNVRVSTTTSNADAPWSSRNMQMLVRSTADYISGDNWDLIGLRPAQVIEV
jgi:hypothetical protein